jgi:hypothetical protein
MADATGPTLDDLVRDIATEEEVGPLDEKVALNRAKGSEGGLAPNTVRQYSLLRLKLIFVGDRFLRRVKAGQQIETSAGNRQRCPSHRS